MIPQIEGVIVAGFFVLSAAAVVFLLQKRSALPPWRKRFVYAAVVFSVAAKMALAGAGHNYDVTSYGIVASIMDHGQSVYANTDRYNYGPIWAWILSGLSYLSRILHVGGSEGLHVLVAGLLATVDVWIALVLTMAYSGTAGMVFLLSPICLLISGFHSQFDNLAVLIAFLAWLIIRLGKPSFGMLVASASLMGVSLATKHVLFLFPAWLVFWKPLGRIRVRILYAAIAYALFFCAFLPWCLDPASRAGIVHNVFEYAGVDHGDTFITLVTRPFARMTSLQTLFQWIPAAKGLQVLWMMLMLVIGVFSARKSVADLFLFYLMTLFAFSPVFSDHYVVIPMAACAVLFRLWPTWGFVGSATGLLLLSPDGPSQHLYWDQFGQILPAAQYLKMGYMYLIVVSQLCLVTIVVLTWPHHSEQEQASPSPETSSESALPINPI